MLVARSSRLALRTASRGILAHTQTSTPTLCLRTVVYQSRASSFLNDNSTPSGNRKPQVIARGSWFARRRKQRNARSKISTLALDSQMMGLTAEQPLLQDSGDHSQQHKHGEQSQSEDLAKRSNRKMRRLVMWCTILSMPIWGHDIIEVVVPGMLGVVIFVASKIKAGIALVRSPFRSESGR